MVTFSKTFIVLVVLLVSVDAHAFHCTVTTTPVSFGGYDVFSSAPSDTTGMVSISCNNPEKKAMPVTIAINRGNSGSFNPRQMLLTGGNDRMNYYLFLDSSRTTIWGDGSGGSSIVIRTIDKTTPVNVPIYGRIPARQNLKAGSYGDNLVVSVDW